MDLTVMTLHKRKLWFITSSFQKLTCNNGKRLCEETAKLSEGLVHVYGRHPTGRKEERKKEGTNERGNEEGRKEIIWLVLQKQHNHRIMKS